MVSESDPQGEIKPSTHKANGQRWLSVASFLLLAALLADGFIKWSDDTVENVADNEPVVGLSDRNFRALLDNKRTNHVAKERQEIKDKRVKELNEKLAREQEKFKILKALMGAKSNELKNPSRGGSSGNELKNPSRGGSSGGEGSAWDKKETDRARNSYQNAKLSFKLFSTKNKDSKKVKITTSDNLEVKNGVSGLGGLAVPSVSTSASQHDRASFVAEDNSDYNSQVLARKDRGGLKQLPAGTVIHAAVNRKIMSDYTGHYTALVTRDVYDTSRNYIVIPKGSTINGEIQNTKNVNEIIQNLIVLTNRFVILPQGRGKIDFSKTSETTNREGINAVPGETNYHWLWRFFGVSSYALLSKNTSYEGSGRDSDRSFKGEFGEGVRDMVRPLSRQLIDLKPTIVLNVGDPIKVLIYDEMYLDPWGHI